MRRSARRTVRAHPLAGGLDPLAAIAALRGRGPVVALESSRPSADHGGQTIVVGAPLSTFTWSRGHGRIALLREGADELGAVAIDDAPTPFHALERWLEAAQISTDGERGGPPIGAFGYFGYELLAEPSLPRLDPFPDAFFLLADTVVHWPRPDARPTLWTADASLAAALLPELEAHRGAAEELVAAAARSTAVAPAPESEPALLDDRAREPFAAAFRAVRSALERGDSYQLCYTFPILRPISRRPEDDPLALYARLRRENPSPFGAFLEAPFGAIASSSPERFLRVDAAGRVEARPMKGTAARPDDPRERARLGRELVTSEKTRAENLMIADLLRNDLGRVCRLGSVQATRPALLEEHATLLQLVSVIEGELRDGGSRADLLAAAFPPGSMTGAPKVRAIELLRAIESGPRGPYSGALGYLAADGTMDLSVVIRSLLVSGGVARANVGGGIVWDSTVEGEFEECRLKALPLLRALRAPASAAARRAAP